MQKSSESRFPPVYIPEVKHADPSASKDRPFLPILAFCDSPPAAGTSTTPLSSAKLLKRETGERSAKGTKDGSFHNNSSSILPSIASSDKPSEPPSFSHTMRFNSSRPRHIQPLQPWLRSIKHPPWMEDYANKSPVKRPPLPRIGEQVRESGRRPPTRRYHSEHSDAGHMSAHVPHLPRVNNVWKNPTNSYANYSSILKKTDNGSEEHLSSAKLDSMFIPIPRQRHWITEPHDNSYFSSRASESVD